MPNNAEKQFDTSNYDEKTRERPLNTGKIKKETSLMEDKKRSKIIKKFTMIGPKTYGCRVQRDEHEIDDSEFIKAKKSKKVHI